MTTELAISNPTSGISGDKEVIAAVQRRIMQMMPGARNAPEPVVWAVAQIATVLNLNPIIGEIYIAEFRGQWGPLISTMGYETLARRIAKFDYRFTPMTVDELKQHRGAEYDPEDYGVKITLRRWDEMKEAKQYGIDYWPVESYGIWRKKGQGGRPDNIHNTWTKVQMAEYRALRTAMKRGFSLGHVEDIEQKFGAFGDDFDIEVAATMQNIIEKKDRDEAPVNGNGLHADDDMLFAGERERPAADEPTMSDEIDEPVEEDEYTDFDESPEDQADPEAKMATKTQVDAIVRMSSAKLANEADAHMAMLCDNKGVNMIDQLSFEQAAAAIDELNKMKPVKQPA